MLSRAYGGGNIHHRTPSHNDLPVPQGDWHEKHQKTQARYNTQLAGSVLLFVGVVAYVSWYSCAPQHKCSCHCGV